MTARMRHTSASAPPLDPLDGHGRQRPRHRDRRSRLDGGGRSLGAPRTCDVGTPRLGTRARGSCACGVVRVLCKWALPHAHCSPRPGGAPSHLILGQARGDEVGDGLGRLGRERLRVPFAHEAAAFVRLHRVECLRGRGRRGAKSLTLLRRRKEVNHGREVVVLIIVAPRGGTGLSRHHRCRADRVRARLLRGMLRGASELVEHLRRQHRNSIAHRTLELVVARDQSDDRWSWKLEQHARHLARQRIPNQRSNVRVHAVAEVPAARRDRDEL